MFWARRAGRPGVQSDSSVRCVIRFPRTSYNCVEIQADKRFLDFLIRDPIRTALLHRSGLPVLVPSPQRYAIHKLIVASRLGRALGPSGRRISIKRAC
ncbi:GSU2403 family nucleotidyltransferase fold protein [Mesorhizobium sp. C416B]|uniref:GSU2403 family nucleotidyltransferase fold protein n=1 Tax=unclassified Mesorhizobium TaxID=325217 RepID=UPI001FD8A1F1|nr:MULTISPECIES: GSU2403 family nucleotidyltransferase fold protein [unclassified Mesorhizobium]WJI64332.1 GSU2403 family nucleotidyltransferase fold protein [Mesorhizobium sp. C416B]